MPKMSMIAVCEAPGGKFVLLRWDFPKSDLVCVWCGRSLGWRLSKGGDVFAHLFDTEAAAEVAAAKYVSLPLQAG